MKRLLLTIAAAMTLSSLTAQIDPMQPIPADKEVRTGKLPNGKIGRAHV